MEKVTDTIRRYIKSLFTITKVAKIRTSTSFSLGLEVLQENEKENVRRQNE